MRSLLGLCLLTLSSPLLGSPSDQGSAWLAFGDLRGYVAPCGCDPLTDLGGIRRLTRFVAETRKNEPGLLLFSLGENFPVKSEPGKATAIQETLRTVKPDALLWRGPETKQKATGLPYVLSHSRKKIPGVNEAITFTNTVVLGFDENAADAKPFSRGLEKAWRKILSAERGKKPILLFAGKTDTLTRIQKSGLFQEVVSGNTAALTAEPTQKEKEEPGRLLRGGSTYMVPSFGQGLLRGGRLRTPARLDLPLDCKPQSLEPRCQKKPSLMSQREELFTWLDRSWDGPSAADAIFASYNKDAAGVFAALAASRAADLKTSPFIGASACSSCHAAAFKVWEKSKHAHAWNTLKEKDKEKDPECVSCHVVGYAAKGGFASMESSPQFANVQCENCHGPRREHAANPTIKPVHDARAACASCHTPPHSPRFNAETYWQQIKHK